MSFQGQLNVNTFQPTAFSGSKFSTAPMTAYSYLLWSINLAGDAVDNVIGSTGYTNVNIKNGTVQAGNPNYATNPDPFAGILVNKDDHVSFGTAFNPLAPTMKLPNGSTATLATQGDVAITISNDKANIGDLIVMDNLTGALSSIPRFTAPSATQTACNAEVKYFNNQQGTGPIECIININNTVAAYYVPAVTKLADDSNKKTIK
jgi:hypothetical protein